MSRSSGLNREFVSNIAEEVIPIVKNAIFRELKEELKAELLAELRGSINGNSGNSNNVVSGSVKSKRLSDPVDSDRQIVRIDDTQIAKIETQIMQACSKKIAHAVSSFVLAKVDQKIETVMTDFGDKLDTVTEWMAYKTEDDEVLLSNYRKDVINNTRAEYSRPMLTSGDPEHDRRNADKMNFQKKTFAFTDDY
ncbi:hypothetical protein E24_00348 [Faustovirus]|nr:hypothetical protein PRJ_Fausto_00329 [Faustovirus]AMN83265.1 hypothetical protein E24_00348 [Faustovirus]AMN84249.1 hypothetical protein D5a_00346 [Faustovirus]AMN85236.1 hypothetical protein E23_00348 [Faustovirus]